VWTATVTGVPESCLVMKIIQPSLCLLPDPSNFRWRETYYDPLDLAHNEAWVYETLVNRQGLSIPYFFGLFDVSASSTVFICLLFIGSDYDSVSGARMGTRP
jgi:hypothetical protein